MKIGVIADTHITKNIDGFEKFLKENLSEVDMIIHAGDYKSIKVLNKLMEFKNFRGVWGNNDGECVRKILKEKEIFNIEGCKIGVYHGHGENKTTIERAYENFKGEKVDIIIFGHSHQPIIKTYNKVLMINPGSPFKKRKEKWNSFIILEIKNKKISVKTIFI